MTIENKFIDYELNQDSYAAFDALTLKDLIVERLSESGQFTDQVYEGSNMSAVIDIVAYSYHVLLFYLNNSAAESTFDQATLYENMNKIVKFIGYKPTGTQTSIASINAVASDGLAIGSYTIKRNSFFVVDGIQYTTIKDYTFDKSLGSEESIQALNDNMILYQGTTVEYPQYTAEGTEFEILTIVDDNIVDSTDDRFIADNTISVYVKEVNDEKYYEYTEVDNLYLSTVNSRVYERRLNEDGHYEIKFGSDTIGKRLNTGDVVAIYYIKSDNEKGIISANTINGNKLFEYKTTNFGTIFDDVFTLAGVTTPINADNSRFLTFNNPVNSTIVTEEETVDQIRSNAPKIIASQLRLVTADDYINTINKTVPNIINSVKVLDNNQYMSDYLAYYYNLCADPFKQNRVLLNQVNFADGCDFNNINIFVVPTFTQPANDSYPPYVSTTLKNLVLDILNPKKLISNEIVPRDPVYIAFTLGFTNNDVNVNVKDVTKLKIVRDAYHKSSKATLKSRVAGTITEFFKPSENELGQTININTLTSKILGIEGIRSISTVNTESNIEFDGISLLSWNPAFPDKDISIINESTKLSDFKFPYLYNPSTILNNIIIVDE